MDAGVKRPAARWRVGRRSGTKKYIFRDFVDTRLLTRADLEALKGDPASSEFRHTLSRVQSDTPQAVISAAVTYYTGMVDTVAHIPDRCYIADGFEPKSFTSPTWDVGLVDPSARRVQVRLINFEDQTPDRASLPVNVAYFFQCNGSYESDPLNGVRLRLQNLSEKYGYYAKIELKTVMADQAKSAQVMADYLRYALPPIEGCLPDWNAVKAGELARPGTTASVAVSGG